MREAPPILVVALTYRVKGWIERTSRVADVIHGPRIGREAARVIAGAKADAVVAVPGLDHLPAGIADDLRSGGPRLVLTDASSMFAPLRGQADATEIALATKAAWIAQHAHIDQRDSSTFIRTVLCVARRSISFLNPND